MWIDYDVQRTTRRCAVTDRQFQPGEEFYSVLAPPEANPQSDLVERRDVCRDAWQGPPDGAIGWWRCRLPSSGSGKARLAPNEVLLDLFERWADEPQQVEARYVLALLLVRRRVLSLQGAEELPAETPPQESMLRLYCSTRGTTYETPVAPPDDERAAAIQNELFQLLYADSK